MSDSYGHCLEVTLTLNIRLCKRKCGLNTPQVKANVKKGFSDM